MKAKERHKVKALDAITKLMEIISEQGLKG